MPEQTPITITKEDLANIVAAAVKAARAPTDIEQQKLDAQKVDHEAKQARRKALAKNIKQEMETKRRIRSGCLHEQPNGNSRAPYIAEKNGSGYLICLKCQEKVRPGPKPANPDFGCTYDTPLFNRLFAKAQSQEMVGV
jgi:hypothetical protein